MSFEPVLPPYNASDPTATFLSSSCLDLLLIELVPMAYRVTNELEAATSASTTTAPSQHPTTTISSSDSVSVSTAPAAAAATAAAGSKRIMDDDEERDAVFYRLETLGYRVGQGLVERYVACPPSPPPPSPPLSPLG